MEIWQNLEKKRNTDYDFPPHYMWAENNKKLTGQNIFRPELFSRRFSVFAEIWGKIIKYITFGTSNDTFCNPYTTVI